MSEALIGQVARRLKADPKRVRPVLQLLVEPDAVPDLGPEDGADGEESPALAEHARRLNEERKAQALRDFVAHSVDSDDVRRMLGGVSRQAVSQRVRSGRLLAARVGLRSRFPAWQFGDGGQPVPGLPAVLPRLVAAAGGPLAADRFMRTALPEEGGRTPAELLQDGELDRVEHYVQTLSGGM